MREGPHPVLERILAARGIPWTSLPAIVSPPPPEPVPLARLEEAVAWLERALRASRPILVFGDYDVDGLAAAALLAEALETAGAEVHVRIPNRLEEGYGLSAQTVEEAAGLGAALVTVDCGVSAWAESEYAATLGVPLLVTDHHEPGPRLPQAPILNPRLDGGPPLSGAGVAWTLASALLGEPFADGLCLAALGTLADQMPVTGWNRSLLHHGLAAPAWTRRPGLVALARRLGLSLAEALPSAAVTFRIAPRLNAAGRLGEADVALALLRARGEAAEPLAERLETLNQTRREIQEAMTAHARTLWPEAAEGIPLIVADEGPFWHRGLLGIVAARLVDEYGQPCLVASRREGTVHASGRAPAGVDLFDALSEVSSRFLRFGGHAQALGCTFAAEHAEELRRLLASIRMPVGDEGGGEVVDTFLRPCEWDADLWQVVAALEPFGPGFPEPTFRLRHVRPREVRSVGATGRRFAVGSVPAVAWAQLPEHPRLDLTARIERDPWGEARITVLAATPSALWAELAALGAAQPYGWPARLAWRALGRMAEELSASGPKLVIVPTPTLVEELLAEFQLLPVGPTMTEGSVTERWQQVVEGHAAGLVAYRAPEGALPEEALAVVPVNPEQLRDFQRRGVRFVRPVACDVTAPDLDDVERLRDVVRARRRGEPVGEAVLAGFAERVFAELGLDEGGSRQVALMASRHFRDWSRHEAARRQSTARLMPSLPARAGS